MKTLTQSLFILGAFAMTALMTSCQTTGSDASSAVTCDKCKTVWVQRPQQIGASGKMASYYMLKSVKSMDCPDCESAVATFFKTGSLQHSCSHCGGALTHCTNH